MTLTDESSRSGTWSPMISSESGPTGTPEGDLGLVQARVERAIGRSVEVIPPSMLSEPDCAACEDTGWTVRGDNRAYQCESCGYWAAMRQRRIDKIFARSGIPAHFETARFDDDFGTDSVQNSGTNPVTEKASNWATNLPGMPKRSLMLYGGFGVGKTWLAIQLLRLIVERFAYDALFITTPELLDRIRETYSGRAEDAEAEVLQAVKDTTLLVLDDLGAERVTDWVQEKLFTIINHRHDHRLATIFTSNLTPGQLASHLGDRIEWRVVEMAECLRLDGPNLRAKPA